MNAENDKPSAEAARYNHAEVEARWQRHWDEHTTLVPVDGNWPPISLVDGGYPVAWLR